MTEYRWGRASWGELPAGVPEKHGWRWRDYEESDGQYQQPLWLARSLPDGDGAVRLGYIADGEPAHVGQEFHEQPVDEYEVLLDAGEWRSPEVIDESDELYLDFAAGGGVPCGRLADGTPLYATLRDREGEGLAPGENRARAAMDFSRQVLVAPSAAAAAESLGPAAVVRELDLKGEAAEIANVGDAPLDLGGWKLRDDSKGKPYVFPAGTVVAAGASVRVRSGPAASRPGPGELVWKTTSVWNDRGDTAFLEDPTGTVVSTKKG
jgi:Lamin Tail Domain